MFNTVFYLKYKATFYISHNYFWSLQTCYYGALCTQANCPFTHPNVPVQGKLKWIAPKTSTPQTATSNTSVVDKTKESGKQAVGLP